VAQVRSASYAKEASDIFAYMTDDASKEDYGTALYWMVLCCFTALLAYSVARTFVCRLKA
jgi:hypothetical protein